MKEWWNKISTGDIRNILAVITVIGAFVMLYMLMIKPVPAQNKDALLTAIGFVLGGLVGGVSGYFFGASKTDNKEKNE